MTTNDQPENQGPLTPAQKYNIAWHQFFDESAHFGNLLQAGISQRQTGFLTTDKAGVHSEKDSRPRRRSVHGKVF